MLFYSCIRYQDIKDMINISCIKLLSLYHKLGIKCKLACLSVY